MCNCWNKEKEHVRWNANIKKTIAHQATCLFNSPSCLKVCLFCFIVLWNVTLIFCSPFSACPNDQVRYGDNCYQRSLADDSDVFSNLDSCGDLAATLWSPVTSNEVAFIKSAFPSTSGSYHLGIEQYVYGKGAFNSDNSFGVGLPFYTGIKHILNNLILWVIQIGRFSDTLNYLLFLGLYA